MKKQTSVFSIRSRLTRQGFSLVETLMATGIISTAALGTLGLLAGSMNSSTDGTLRSRSVVVAQDIFHDLQIGALNVAPATTDERQSRTLRPETGFGFTKHVLLFDGSGVLLSAGQPGENGSQNVYEQGTSLPGVGWLVCMEGIQRQDLTDTSGAGQVILSPDPAAVGPLGSAASYPFLPVQSPSDAIIAPPANTLTQVRISVESPASAPAGRRKKFSYEFLWNRR